MNVDFLATVEKTSKTQFNTSGSAEPAAPGFREQLNRAMRDDERRNESAVDKKSSAQKKPQAAAGTRISAKSGEKTAEQKINDLSDPKYAADETAAGETAAAETNGKAETASETDCPFVLTGEESGFNGLLEESAASETDSIYVFTPAPAEPSQTENDYASVPTPSKPSENEFAYTSGQDEFEDSSVSSSTGAEFFTPAAIRDDSGFAGMMNMQASAEKTVSGADLNAASNWNTSAEVISNATTGHTAVAPPEETGANVLQNDSFPDSDEINGAKAQMTATVGDAEPIDAESARPATKEIPEDGLFLKNLPLTQNFDRNATVSLRGEGARSEIPPEQKTPENAEPSELSKQFLAGASSEDDDLLLERLAAQAMRPRETASFAKTSESAGKTTQVTETSVNMTSGTAKAEASVTPRSVNASDHEFVIELAGRIQAQIRGGREMIRIQLHPEELGRLEIQAVTGRNGIIARIAAETMDVKKLLESNLQTLQHTLESRGLKVDRLHIIVEESMDAALFADGGRYGHNGTGLRNSEVSEFSTFPGAGIESPQEEDAGDLTAEAARRGAGFYTVG